VPRVVRISPADLEWLRSHHHSTPYPIGARRLGVCVDTYKRILVRQGLQDLQGAKYVVARRATDTTDLWRRPCLACRCTKPRPRWQFRCTSCHDRDDQDESPWE
jgi:hypothetical protein